MLSGDAPETVAAIAADAGIAAASAVDGSKVADDPDALERPCDARRRRISPEGKRAVVQALRDRGRYVAMVGDGVNDVPALKESRLAIAPGDGHRRWPRAWPTSCCARRLQRGAEHGRRGQADTAQPPAGGEART